MAEKPIVDRSIHIVAIESDPVILSGLVTCLNRFPDLQVVAEAESVASAWQILTNLVAVGGSLAKPLPWRIDLVLLGLPLHHPLPDRSSLGFCQQFKVKYPNLPILLLISPQDRDVTTAFQLGIEGCCLRGSSILDLVAGIRAVAAGETNWAPEILAQVKVGIEDKSGNLLDRLRLASLQQIDVTLAKLNSNLTAADTRIEDDRQSSMFDRLIITGRKRELNTARWLVNKIFPATVSVAPPVEDNSSSGGLVSAPKPETDRPKRSIANSV